MIFPDAALRQGRVIGGVFGMGQRAGGPLRVVELFGHAERLDGDLTVLRIRHWQEALRLLRGSVTDPAEMAAIRHWAYARDFPVRRSDDDLLRDLAQAAFSGRIVLAMRKRRVLTAYGDESRRPSRPDDPAPRPVRPPRPAPPTRPDRPDRPPAPPPPQEVRTWIEFRLLDDETEEPISGVPFLIELTDGTTATHTTDSSGMIRIDGLDPGTCGIHRISADGAPEVTRVK